MAIAATDVSIWRLIEDKDLPVFVLTYFLGDNECDQLLLAVMPDMEDKYGDQVKFVEIMAGGYPSGGLMAERFCKKYNIREYPSVLMFFNGICINCLNELNAGDPLVVRGTFAEQREVIDAFIGKSLKVLESLWEKHNNKK